MASRSPLKPNAVILLSGGLDSATVLYWAYQNGYRPACLTVQYGQIHAREIQNAKKIARSLKLPHEICHVPMPWKGSALLDRKIKMPRNRSFNAIGHGIPATYVPARNTILLSLALGWAETLKAKTIFIGAHQLDYSGYPDCRPEYFQALQRAFNKGTKMGRFKIVAPLLKKDKAQIIRLAHRLGVPLQWTWSCYSGGAQPCGTCDSCRLRQAGFEKAGLKDPVQ